jgi:CRP/FNR family transcriptional regulator, cyclic AMP receptor protein
MLRLLEPVTSIFLCDGCYRVDDGLLKVAMVTPAGSERILAFLGPGAIVVEMIIDRKF